jgi:hypothetical protein
MERRLQQGTGGQVKLRYERLAIAVFSAMLTTMLLTEYATQRSPNTVDQPGPLPQAGQAPAATTGP